MKRLLLVALLLCVSASAQMWPFPGPGSPTAAVTPTAATPTFEPVAGTYTGTQTVTISSSTAGAALCYTTDGSDPAAATPGTCSAGSTYSTPVSVASSLTLKALATKAAYINSAVGSAGYTINAPTGASDDFAGAAGALGTPNWTQTMSQTVKRDGSGMVTGTAWQTGSGARWTSGSFTDNQYSEVVIGAVGADWVATGVRLDSSGRGYYFGTKSGSVYRAIIRVDGTNGTSQAALKSSTNCGGASALSVGDTLRIEVSGTVLTAKVNGTAVCTWDTASDATKYSTGLPGIWVANGSTGTIDAKANSFAAGNL